MITQPMYYIVSFTVNTTLILRPPSAFAHPALAAYNGTRTGEKRVYHNERFLN
jgi:hypothetical protein